MEENENMAEEAIPTVTERVKKQTKVVDEEAPVVGETIVEEMPVAEIAADEEGIQQTMEAAEQSVRQAMEAVEQSVQQAMQAFHGVSPDTNTYIDETVSAIEEMVIEEVPTKKIKAEKSVPTGDFDWDAYEHGVAMTASSKAELEKVYDKTLNAIKDKEVVEGTVILINKREVVVNVGYKSDGIVSMSEFRYNPDLAVGDKVEVYIESQEDKKGQLILSHKQARATRSWDRVNEALQSQEIVKGFVKCRTKGGMIVDVFGVEAFLPGSQIDVKPIRDYDIFVNKTMEFKVIKINQEFKNVVVSHKALIEAELELQKKEIIGKLQKGQVLEGTVKNITSYGVFIDLGGVDGLIHITDLSWGRVSHPEEIVTLDQKLNVVILDFDNEKKRIALGLKQLSPHPWDALNVELKVGDKIKGKVVVMADYGAFVEIAQGVEGLIHVSEMTWSQHLRSAQEFLKVGDEVEALILTLDREERKMSLGIKQLRSDPWDNIDDRYAAGTRHTAKVRNFTTFGIFVEIEEGVDGLVHISDLSWTRKVKHPSEFTQIGGTIEVQVLEIDKANRRLSLGHKQLEENPWDVLETVFTIDSIHEGVVVETIEKGSVVSLAYDVEGFGTPKHMVKEDGSQVQVGEKLFFKVIEFNKDSKRVILSHSRIYEDLERAEEVSATEDSAKKAAPKRTKKAGSSAVSVPSAAEKTTLGDIQSLSELKDKMNVAAEKAATKEKKAKEVEVTPVLEAPVVDKTPAPAKKASAKKDAPIKETSIEKVSASVEKAAKKTPTKKVVDATTKKTPTEKTAAPAKKASAKKDASIKETSAEKVSASVEKAVKKTPTKKVADATTKKKPTEKVSAPVEKAVAKEAPAKKIAKEKEAVPSKKAAPKA